MKNSKILQAAIIISFITLATGCVVAHPYAPPPVPRASVSLIVNPFPGITVHRYYDGRYYYRNPQGYTYWHGYDNRYYLDRSHVGRSYYNHREYNGWKRGYNNGRRRH